MGSITTGIGLISGINTAQLIDSLIALESRGKVSLQNRIATLQSQRTALLDVNARLLNMKTASRAFRIGKLFQSSLAASSNAETLTASAGTNAQPGSYQFIVRRLVSTSQQLSRGFATRNTTPLGLSELSFEFGRGRVSTDTELERLNGGDGVDRGRIVITDRSGGQATIDLTDVVTLNEVIERINTATAAEVTATIDGDNLIITDDSGGAGMLTIANATGDTTATDLGIAGSNAGGVITGTNINTLGLGTALAALNDGTGVLTRDNVTDFTITARDGTLLNIELGRIDAPITNATLLADLNNGDGVTIAGDGEKDIKFIDRDGASYEVDLSGITTVGGLITRVSTATSGRIALSVHADGERLSVTDTVGGAGNLQVLGAGPNGTDTAEDLGILQTGVAASTFDGEVIPNTISDPPTATLGAVIDRINDADGNGGKIVAAIAADGVSLLITDTTGGGSNLIIRSTASNPYAAAALGIETAVAGVAANSVDGTRLIAGLNSVLASNLNGGAGLDGATTLTITDRSGASFTLNNLSTFDSLQDIIDEINDEAVAAGVDVTAAFNDAGNGLSITDTSGATASNLIITGDAADALGIAANVADDEVAGTNLQHRYVDEASPLSDLNYGRGIGIGRFRITDSLGDTAEVDIGTDAVTLYDIIAEINSRGLAINARINDTGDGIAIEADLGGGETAIRTLKVESLSGTAAKDLNILGESETIDDAVIDGSYERTIELSATDTLDEVVAAINAAGIPARASVINAGSGATPWRLSITSSIAGRNGDLIIDTANTDLGLTALSRGEDARIFFGGATPETSFLITSSSNEVTGVIEGVTLNLLETSDDPVTVTVERDMETITAGVTQLVTTFNDVIGRINGYDFFDVDTKKKGPLLGNPTTARVREALYRVLQQRVQGVDTQYQFLREVGITIGTDGELKFNQEKFLAAYANDPEAVANLFAAFEASAATSEEIAPGVTIQSSDLNVTTRGFGDLFDTLLDDLTNSIDGVLSLADDNFQSQIDAANKRIEEFDIRLAAKRTRLERQFTAMEAALAQLQGQSNALNSLASNVFLAQTQTGAGR